MTPQLCRTAEEFRSACERVRARGGRLGVVPTMGALHAAHRALVRKAHEQASDVAVTIFVNPIQFGPQEDLDRYPRDLEGDLAQCRAENVGLVFAPSIGQMYPEGERTRVSVTGLTDHLCGASRPGHFEGVATIVTKLFALAGPCTAVFGRKDYQQLKVIQRLVRDLLLPVRIVSHPTVREADGLALSSRNQYLSPADREAALAIPQSLSEAVRAFQAGERRAHLLREPIVGALRTAGLSIDYVMLADPEELEPFGDHTTLGERALCAVAALCGNTRLIDNVVLGEDPAPIGAG